MKMLKPRLATIQTSRVKEQKPRVSGSIERMRGSSWMALRERILKRDCGICQECQRNGRLSVATQVDHKVPLHRGGTNDTDNLESICTSCHSAKTAREVAEMYSM